MNAQELTKAYIDLSNLVLDQEKEITYQQSEIDKLRLLLQDMQATVKGLEFDIHRLQERG